MAYREQMPGTKKTLLPDSLSAAIVPSGEGPGGRGERSGRRPQGEEPPRPQPAGTASRAALQAFQGPAGKIVQWPGERIRGVMATPWPGDAKILPP